MIDFRTKKRVFRGKKGSYIVFGYSFILASTRLITTWLRISLKRVKREFLEIIKISPSG